MCRFHRRPRRSGGRPECIIANICLARVHPMAKNRPKPSPGANGVHLRYRRIVAKFGSNVLTAGADRLSSDVMAALTAQVATLHEAGAELIVVTSGAIAAGPYRLDGRKE